MNPTTTNYSRTSDTSWLQCECLHRKPILFISPQPMSHVTQSHLGIADLGVKAKRFPTSPKRLLIRVCPASVLLCPSSLPSSFVVVATGGDERHSDE